jgi:hypothetical protein
VNGEFYIAPVYNYLIAASLDVRINVAEEVGVMGTPEDLRAFEEERAGRRVDVSPLATENRGPILEGPPAGARS